MNIKSRYKKARRVLIFITLFIAVGATVGAAGMLADPSGELMKMDSMLPYFTKLPFSDVLFKNYVFSGIALFAVNGLPNFIAAGLLFSNKKSGIILGGICGITLALWICIQFYMFPLNFMSTAFFVIGIMQATVGYACRVFYEQENFHVDTSEYKNIGMNPQKLVIFFSRMGYVKKFAYMEANRTGAEIYEIKSSELTEGTRGFWWCGRYGMHKWDMPIEPVEIDLARYNHITICSPIWVFSLAAPVRTFCRKYAGKIKEADYILVHHQNDAYENAAKEMDTLLKIEHTRLRSIQCREGRYSEE